MAGLRATLIKLRSRLVMLYRWWFLQSNIRLNVFAFLFYCFYVFFCFFLYSSFIEHFGGVQAYVAELTKHRPSLSLLYNFLVFSSIYVFIWSFLLVGARYWAKVGAGNNTVYFYALKGWNADQEVLREYLKKYVGDNEQGASVSVLRGASKDNPSYHIGMFFVKSEEASVMPSPGFVIRRALEGLGNSRAPILIDPGFSFEFRDGELARTAAVQQPLLGGRKPVITDWSSYHASLPRFSSDANPLIVIYFDAINEIKSPIDKDDLVSERHFGEIRVKAQIKPWFDCVNDFIGTEFEDVYYEGSYHDFPRQFSNRRGPAFVVRLKPEKADDIIRQAFDDKATQNTRIALKSVAFKFCAAHAVKAQLILDHISWP
jgi:hypothetical protein